MVEGIFLCSALFVGLLLPFLWTDVQGGLHRGSCPGLPLGSASQGSDPGLPGAGGAEELPLTDEGTGQAAGCWVHPGNKAAE